MPNAPNDDLAWKAAAMLEFRKFRDSGLPVPPEVRARHVEATNDGYTTGPDPGQTIPAFSLPDQTGAVRTLADLSGPDGLLLVFHRSAEWCQYCRSQLVELELSRGLLENNRIKVAAVSYDSMESLAAFSRQYSIGYPLLSDRDSQTIRNFGIFNQNMAPHLKAYGVAHPVTYLVSPEGVVLRKDFVPNYMHRVTASSIALSEFAAVAGDAPAVMLKTGVLTAAIGLSSQRAFSGQELGFFAKFTLETGWHVYGAPLPPGYTATAISFDETFISRQTFTLPGAVPVPNPLLHETLPVYSGAFAGSGTLLLKNALPNGELALEGRLELQQCSDAVCEAPISIPFTLRVQLEPFVINDRDRKVLEQQSASRTAS